MAVSGDLVTNLIVNSNRFGPGLKKGRGEIKSFVSSAKSALLPLAGLIAGSLGARESINAARTQIAEERKLEAVLKATGNAAGLSAEQIKGFAAARQDVTSFGDELTISGAAVLATFKEVKGSVFEESIVLAQDMSSVMGQDLKGSIVQFGKALNDPIRGVSALSKVGVSFTQQQKEQIKALQESGNMLGAQAVIMGELRSEFGGAAEAMADPLTQMSNLVGDLGENIGFVLLPSIKELYEGLKDGIGPITANAQGFKELGLWIGSGVKFVVDYGKHIVAAGIAMGTLVIATNAIRVATFLWAKGLLFVQALSGPKGWATAAAGLALYAGSVYAIDYAFQETEQSANSAVAAVEQIGSGKSALAGVRQEADALNSSLLQQGQAASALMQKYSQGAASLQTELLEIEQLVNSGALTADQAELFSGKAIESATGITGRISDLKDEIALLKGETNEAALELKRLYEKGAPLPLLDDLAKAIQLRDQLKRQADQAKEEEREKARLVAQAERDRKASQGKGVFEQLAEAKERSKQLIDSLKSPADRRKEDLREYAEQLNLGNINQSQHDQLVAKREREFQQSSGAERSGPNSALESSGTEAISLLARAYGGAGTVSVQERSARTQERIEAHQRVIAERIKQQNDHLAKLIGKPAAIVKMGG